MTAPSPFFRSCGCSGDRDSRQWIYCWIG